jgi:hypothetical protein
MHVSFLHCWAFWNNKIVRFVIRCIYF